MQHCVDPADRRIGLGKLVTHRRHGPRTGAQATPAAWRRHGPETGVGQRGKDIGVKHAVLIAIGCMFQQQRLQFASAADHFLFGFQIVAGEVRRVFRFDLCGHCLQNLSRTSSRIN